MLLLLGQQRTIVIRGVPASLHAESAEMSHCAGGLACRHQIVVLDAQMQISAECAATPALCDITDGNSNHSEYHPSRIHALQIRAHMGTRVIQQRECVLRTLRVTQGVPRDRALPGYTCNPRNRHVPTRFNRD